MIGSATQTTTHTRSGRLTPAQARSRLVRVKTSDAVAEHIIDLLFAGELRAGDRIDLEGLATSLGVSRAPVREALVALERDGLIEIRYHRGAFVADFDADGITESFQLYAMLSALTTRRAAEQQDPRVLSALDDAIAAVRTAVGDGDVDAFEEHARQFRRIVNTAVAGSRLRALLRSFGGLVPVASRLSLHRSVDRELGYLQAEHAALLAGDPDAAADAAIAHISLLGEQAVATLQQRGVLGRRTRRPPAAALAATVAALDRARPPAPGAGRAGPDADQGAGDRMARVREVAP